MTDDDKQYWVEATGKHREENLDEAIAQEPPIEPLDISSYDFEPDSENILESENYWYDRQIELQYEYTEYVHDPKLPRLPYSQEGSLFGIGFAYDEDCDSRIFIAIDQLQDSEDIVSLFEHKGDLEIYARTIIDEYDENEIDVCNDYWQTYLFVPYFGRWEKVTPEIREYYAKEAECKRLAKLETARKMAEPATEKQIKYLYVLGHRGATPKTKAEAGILINKYKNN
jgi:hypothetical protein